jgi:hypothetical protein
MKKLLLAILLTSFLPVTLVGQIDTSVVVFSWKLDESYANRIRTSVDTLLENFQHHLQPFNQYTGVVTLGNYGLPTQSIVFTERDLNQEFLLINNYMPFMKLYDHTGYYNTRKPFTKLVYFRGGSSQNKEEMLDAFHTQNITKTINIGLHYSTVRALGQYNFQRVRDNSFRFFSNKAGQVYSYHLSVNLNKIIADENGGILNDSLITDTTYAFTKDIPTLFSGKDNPPEHYPDVYNEIHNINVLAMQEIAFRSKEEKPDSTTTLRKIRVFYPKLVYIFAVNRTVRLFNDIKPSVGLNSGLYPALNVNNTFTADSLLHWKFLNTARLQFQGRKNNHYFIDYSYEMMKYALSVAPDASDSLKNDDIWFITEAINLPGINLENSSFNSYFSSGFTKVFANLLEINLYGRYYLSGYRKGDFLVSGDMKLSFGKTDHPVTFLARGTNELRTPDFLYTHYASNNFIWTKNFSKTSLNHLSTILALSSKKFEIQADYYLLRNHIYLNKEAFPEQYQTALSILVLSAAKRFDFWKITSDNRLVYQKSENVNVLDLPEIAYYNSTYLTHLFNFKGTGGKLLTMFGFDVYYNTKYYADAYMPSLASFHRQDEKQLGNYPYFDAFVNIQLKRFRFFLKVQHVNAGWMDKNYFSVLHYPRNTRDLKFGIAWTFYD